MIVVQKWQAVFWPTLPMSERRTPHRPLLDLGEEGRLSYHKKTGELKKSKNCG